MNVVTESLKMSTLYASATAGNNKDIELFQYDLPKAYPNVFKDFHVKHDVPSIGFNSSKAVEISSFGLAREMYLKWKVSFKNSKGAGAAADVAAVPTCPNVAKHLYARIVKRIALMNSSREIMQTFGDLIQMRTIAMEDKGEKSKWLLAGSANLQIAKADIQTADKGCAPREVKCVAEAKQELTFYTKIPFSMFEGRFQSDDSRKTAYNFRFLEVCRLLIETNPAYECFAGTVGGITEPKIESCQLFVHYDIPSAEDMRAIESQFSLDTPLSMLNGNSVLTESSVRTGAGDTVCKHEMKIYNTYLCQNFVVCVHRERTEDDAKALADHIHTVAAQQDHWSNAGVSRYGSDYKKLNRLVVRSSGRVIFESDDYAQLLLTTTPQCNWLDVSPGSSKEVNETMDKEFCNDSNFYLIPFSDLTHSNVMSGALALKGLSTCDITVEFPCTESTTYKIKIYTNYQQITSVDSNSGKLVQSVSS